MDSYTFGTHQAIEAVLNAPEAPKVSGEPYEMRLNASAFETVFIALVERGRIGDPEAEQLASDIASTLGVEWI